MSLRGRRFLMTPASNTPISRYDTLIVDEDTTCVRTRSRRAALQLATKLVKDGKAFEFESLHDEHFEFLISEENERKGWVPE